MSAKIWKVYPPHAIVMELLERKGSMTDSEILEALKDIYKDIGVDDLNKLLMEMEIYGKVNVSTLMRGKRLVELRKK
ncbi:hypothetical protein DRO55_02830 [Candidatus Bathyarchaeota archaeon]|nr:MAG: hypothetical protein DRO55_02830 [Candidatus Bathyarchaeota archaeon]